MMRIFLITGLGFLVLVGGSRDLRADAIRIDFEAVVTYVSNILCGGCLSEVEVGDTIRGYYIYDTNVADSNPDPHTGRYEYSVPPNGIVAYLDVGTDVFVFQTDTTAIDVVLTVGDSLTSGGLHDSYWYVSNNNVDESSSTGMGWIWINLVDNTATALSSDSLPSVSPNLGDWQTNYDLIIAGRDNEWVIWSDLISISEPPTAIREHDPYLTLHQNYPNPFNPTTTLWFQISNHDRVILDIFDVGGKRVRRLVDSNLYPADYRLSWNGRNDDGARVASGVYFYRLTAGDKSLTKKMVLLK
jgi:hypothetical protein